MNLETAPQPLEEEASPIDKMILLIDDDTDHLEAMSWRLQRQGFRVNQASDGESGLHQLKEERPSLVVLDLQLPDCSGLSVCSEIADNEGTCQIPIIIVSGSEEQDIVRRCRQAGCHYFVRKPYDPNALLVLIERALTDDFDW